MFPCSLVVHLVNLSGGKIYRALAGGDIGGLGWEMITSYITRQSCPMRSGAGGRAFLAFFEFLPFPVLFFVIGRSTAQMRWSDTGGRWLVSGDSVVSWRGMGDLVLYSGWSIGVLLLLRSLRKIANFLGCEDDDR